MFSNTRILEGTELRSVDGLAEELDLKSLTGVDFNVPLVSHHSSLAIAIANHLHYEVHQHMGPETVYRLSLNKVMILKGR